MTATNRYFMRRYGMLPWFLLSMLLLNMLLLASCSSTHRPVVIRDVLAPEIVKPSLAQDQSSSVTPTRDNKHTPLQTQLLQQAQKEYHQGNIQQAIVLAERGLRIDRQTPEFYLVLAQAYLQLGNRKQSQSFARQGLRYVNQAAALHQQLLLLTQ